MIYGYSYYSPLFHANVGIYMFYKKLKSIGIFSPKGVDYKSEIDADTPPGVVDTIHAIVDFIEKGEGSVPEFDWNNINSSYFTKDYTPWEKSVLKEITKIPKGQTATYKEIAERAGRPKAFRSVGTICGQNPLPVIIPCHRVVSASGKENYAWGVEVKRKLLKREMK